jgi:hypothetical protein
MSKYKTELLHKAAVSLSILNQHAKAAETASNISPVSHVILVITAI